MHDEPLLIDVLAVRLIGTRRILDVQVERLAVVGGLLRAVLARRARKTAGERHGERRGVRDEERRPVHRADVVADGLARLVQRVHVDGHPVGGHHIAQLLARTDAEHRIGRARLRRDCGARAGREDDGRDDQAAEAHRLTRTMALRPIQRGLCSTDRGYKSRFTRKPVKQPSSWSFSYPASSSCSKSAPPRTASTAGIPSSASSSGRCTRYDATYVSAPASEKYRWIVSPTSTFATEAIFRPVLVWTV